ncbi:MAG: DUF554 domain-containing protein [Sporolactobacillus sp.]
MPVGVLVDVLAVFIGSLIGAFFGEKIPERLRVSMPMTFGAASMGMGIALIIKVETLPAVVLALVLGSAIGELIRLEKGIEWCANKVRGPIERLFSSNHSMAPKYFLEQFVGIVVLFCASGTGIFGALNEGMTGDASILFSKAVLDFFTAAIFATALGYMVVTIAVPQFFILLGLFLSAGLILPMVNGHLINDFSALGGIIMFVTGLRISGIKSVPVANMRPGLVLVMPLSALWLHFFS